MTLGIPLEALAPAANGSIASGVQSVRKPLPNQRYRNPYVESPSGDDLGFMSTGKRKRVSGDNDRSDDFPSQDGSSFAQSIERNRAGLESGSSNGFDVLAGFASKPFNARTVSETSAASSRQSSFKSSKPASQYPRGPAWKLVDNWSTTSTANSSFESPANSAATSPSVRNFASVPSPELEEEEEAMNGVGVEVLVDHIPLTIRDNINNRNKTHSYLNRGSNPVDSTFAPVFDEDEDSLFVEDSPPTQKPIVPGLLQARFVDAAAQNPVRYIAQGHQALSLTDPYKRLLCFVLDFALSPSLTSQPHRAAPYFLPATGRLTSAYLTMEFSQASGTFAQVAQAYHLSTDTHKIVITTKTFSERLVNGDSIYSIRCSGQAYYPSGNKVTIGYVNGIFPPWQVEFGPSWRLGASDDKFMQDMSWQCIVQLLAAHAEVAFDINGSERSELEVENRVAALTVQDLSHVEQKLWLRMSLLGGFGSSVEALRQMDIAGPHNWGGVRANETGQM